MSPDAFLMENRGGFWSAGQEKIIQEKEGRRVSEDGTKFGRSVEKRGREGNRNLDGMWRRERIKKPRGESRRAEGSLKFAMFFGHGRFGKIVRKGLCG